ncbi:MAG: Ig-like domain-containing protein, partial [Rubrobacteraceae bacterium]
KAKLNPNRNLRAGTTYTAVVNTGANDLAGNPLSARKV